MPSRAERIRAAALDSLNPGWRRNERYALADAITHGIEAALGAETSRGASPESVTTPGQALAPSRRPEASTEGGATPEPSKEDLREAQAWEGAHPTICVATLASDFSRVRRKGAEQGRADRQEAEAAGYERGRREAKFSCCGGSDENPPEHNQDCEGVLQGRRDAFEEAVRITQNAANAWRDKADAMCQPYVTGGNNVWERASYGALNTVAESIRNAAKKKESGNG